MSRHELSVLFSIKYFRFLFAVSWFSRAFSFLFSFCSWESSRFSL